METQGSLIAIAAQNQRRFEARSSADERRSLGHFGTPAAIAEFMASLFRKIPDQEVRILDPGAGVGMLTAAVCQRIAKLRARRMVTIEAYENEPKLIPHLEETLKACRSALERSGHSMRFAVHVADFILANADRKGTLFGEAGTIKGRFDIVIMNPPYFKLRKESAHARAMADLIHGQPNIYALFMALGAEALRAGGEIVAITPRSYCNGLYFRSFRRWFFRVMFPHHIHVFESREAAFREQEVLQENMILAAVKERAGKKVILSSTVGREFTGPINRLALPLASVLHANGQDCVLRIPSSAMDVRLQNLFERWPTTFAQSGFRISTGPIVAFRAKKFLLADRHGTSAVPLLSMHNVLPYEVRWPLRRNGKPSYFSLCKESMRLLLPAKRYVVLRRFSAKEERRRIVAAVFEGENGQQYIGFENHLNYIGRANGELSQDEACGLTAVLNSTLLDRYFRTLSGNTQVNATDIRCLPLPAMDSIRAIGEQVAAMNEVDCKTVERAIADELHLDKPLRAFLLEHT